MVKSVWDLCYLDSEFLAQIESINSISTNKSSCNSLKASPEVTEKIGVGAISSICNLQDSITEAENACTNSLILLDNILTVLNDVSSAYSDVTGRTNNLMINCETLLEQQVSHISFQISFYLIKYEFSTHINKRWRYYKLLWSLSTTLKK